MAWNPSPKVKVARYFGDKFNYDKVFIIGINESSREFEVTSYGKTKKKCDEAKTKADVLYYKMSKGEIVLHEFE